jgi:hypothetical protein
MAAAADSKVRAAVSSGKPDREDKRVERKAAAAIKSPPEMTARIPFPM